jgi:hypothetical protein
MADTSQITLESNLKVSMETLQVLKGLTKPQKKESLDVLV